MKNNYYKFLEIVHATSIKDLAPGTFFVWLPNGENDWAPQRKLSVPGALALLDTVGARDLRNREGVVLFVDSDWGLAVGRTDCDFYLLYFWP